MLKNTRFPSGVAVMAIVSLSIFTVSSTFASDSIPVTSFSNYNAGFQTYGEWWRYQITKTDYVPGQWTETSFLSSTPNGESVNQVYGVVWGKLIYSTGDPDGYVWSTVRWYARNLSDSTDTLIYSAGYSVDVSITDTVSVSWPGATKLIFHSTDYSGMDPDHHWIYDVSSWISENFTLPADSSFFGIVKPGDPSKYIYSLYDESIGNMMTYLSDGTILGPSFQNWTQYTFEFFPSGNGGVVTSYSGGNWVLSYSPNDDFSSRTDIATMKGYPNWITLGEERIFVFWWDWFDAKMKAAVVFTDGVTPMIPIEWISGYFPIKHLASHSWLTYGKYGMMFRNDFGHMSLHLFDMETYAISDTGISIEWMAENYFSFVMSAFHGIGKWYLGMKKFDTNFARAASISHNGDGDYDLSSSSIVMQSLLPNLTRVEFRDPLKVSNWQNSFLENTKSNMFKIGNFFIKAYE